VHVEQTRGSIGVLHWLMVNDSVAWDPSCLILSHHSRYKVTCEVNEEDEAGGESRFNLSQVLRKHRAPHQVRQHRHVPPIPGSRDGAGISP